MGSTNFGTQLSVFSYKKQLSSELLGSMNYQVKAPGIYSGFAISKVSNTLINIATGTFIIEDSTTFKVSMSTRTTVAINNLTVSSSATYIIWRLIWTNTTSNYVDIYAKGAADLLPTDVVIGRLVYNTAPTPVLLSVDYSYRTWGNLDQEHISVDPVATLLHINPRTNFWYQAYDGFLIKYVNVSVKNNPSAPFNYVNFSSGGGVAAGSYYITYDGTNFSYVASSVAISYSSTMNGWYYISGSVNYRILALVYYTGGVSGTLTVNSIYDRYNVNSIDSTLGGASPVDYLNPSQKAIKTLLETRGYTDDTLVKGITNPNWDTNAQLLKTGQYLVTGYSQTGITPNGSTTDDWLVSVNMHNSGSSIDQIALDKDRNILYSRTFQYGSPITIWTCYNNLNLNDYLDSALKSIIYYNADNSINIVYYYNSISSTALGNTIGKVTMGYINSVLTTVTTILYYPAGTVWKTHSQALNYDANLRLYEVTDIIS